MLWASSICCIFFHNREGQKLILKVTDHCFVIICFQCLGYKKTKPNSKGGKKAVSNGSNNPSILLCQALLYSHPGRRCGFNFERGGCCTATVLPWGITAQGTYRDATGLSKNRLGFPGGLLSSNSCTFLCNWYPLPSARKKADAIP